MKAWRLTWEREVIKYLYGGSIEHVGKYVADFGFRGMRFNNK